RTDSPYTEFWGEPSFLIRVRTFSQSGARSSDRRAGQTKNILQFLGTSFCLVPHTWREACLFLKTEEEIMQRTFRRTAVMIAFLVEISVAAEAATTNVVFRDFSFTPRTVTIQVG